MYRGQLTELPWLQITVAAAWSTTIQWPVAHEYSQDICFSGMFNLVGKNWQSDCCSSFSYLGPSGVLGFTPHLHGRVNPAFPAFWEILQ